MYLPPEEPLRPDPQALARLEARVREGLNWLGVHVIHSDELKVLTGGRMLEERAVAKSVAAWGASHGWDLSIGIRAVVVQTGRGTSRNA